MNRFSQCLALGAALGLCVGCSSTDSSDGNLGGSSSQSNAGGLGHEHPDQGGSPGSGGTLGGAGSPSGSGGKPGSTGGTPPVMTSSAAQIAVQLGRPANFLIGMGNDNDASNDHNKDGAFRLGTTLDLQYKYLSAYLNADKSWGSWKDWNAEGSFINIIADTADAHGVVPMISLYSMAAAKDGVIVEGLKDEMVFQPGYWGDVRLLFQRLAIFGKPAVVHFEPDFWAYAEQQSHEDPTSMKVALRAAAPECAELTEDLVGMGYCIIKLARMYAPKAIIGFHASRWANGDPNATAAFLKRVGADRTDVIFADMIDRDVGCFEAKVDPNCQRGGDAYWDETNTTSPNFHEYLAWSKAISAGVGRPMMWWQIPFGVPSDTPGGTADHYRDNRVHYIFSHIQEFVDAGGVGAVFGVGTGNQTTPDTDGGQFKDAVTKYYQSPVPLK
jgi:hypothetical protein